MAKVVICEKTGVHHGTDIGWSDTEFPTHRQIITDYPVNFIIHELIEQYFDPELPQLW